MIRAATVLVLVLAAAGCRPDPCDAHDGAGAPSTCVEPTLDEAHYVAQSELYFDSMDYAVTHETWPDYGETVARWEWPPWLKLTAFGRDNILATDTLLTLYPSTVPERDCRFFAEQPFGRCRVVFFYDDASHEGRGCPIYEEFTFNGAGEVTFIEAWSDLPGMRPSADDDPWAEGEESTRLSTRVPGLGTSSGEIVLDSPWMREAARDDADVADFVYHAEDWYTTWLEEVEAAGDDMWERGCGW